MDARTRRHVFEYREIFEDRRTYHGFSAGNGVFHDAEPEIDVADPDFMVLKDRTASRLDVTFFKPGLRSFFVSAFPNEVSLYSMESFSCDFTAILSNYTILQELFQSGQWHKLDEVRLFMEDFLLDIHLWSSFGFERLYELGILSASHWQDMQKWSLERQIDDLEQLIDTDDDDHDEEDDPTSTNEPIAINAQECDKWLWLAAKEGRSDEVRQHLTRRTRLVDAKCLTVTLQRGHIDIFWILFNFGTAVRGDPNRWMAEPIYAAARFGYLEALQCLIYRANIPTESHLAKLCYTPLKGAVHGGHEGIVSYFISLGVGVTSLYVEVILMRCAREGQLSMIRLLRSLGVPLPGIALAEAARHGHHELVEYLLGAKVVTKSSCYAQGALRFSIERNDLRSLLPLLDYGVDPGECCYSLSSDDKNWLMCTAKESNRSEEMIRTIEQIPLQPFDRPLYTLTVDWPLPIYWDWTETRFKPYERQGVTLKKQVFASKGPNHCPITARIRARERLVLRTRLRENFVRMHSEFLDRCSSLDACYELFMFVEEIGTAQRIWKKGFDVIRRLLNNQLPSSLQEVFSCVQLSRSMRSTLDGSTDLENAEADDVFLTDLERWKLMVPNDDRGLYDEISRLVWGKSDNTILANMDWLREQDNLQYFQKLMTSLISESHSAWAIPNSCCEAEGRRLSDIHEEFNVHSDAPNELNKSHTSAEEQNFSSGYDRIGDPGGIIEEWKTASPRVIALTTTTIFVVIITFFLVLRYCGIETISPHFMATLKIQRSLQHYCYILALYLGVFCPEKSPWIESDMLSSLLSPSPQSQFSSSNQVDTSPQGSSQYDPSVLSQSGPSADSFALQYTPSNLESPASGGTSQKKQCPKCFKTFSTISNLNKHKKTDCKNGKNLVRYPCRNTGCGLTFTRVEYRGRHEKQRCPVIRRTQYGA